ncbi:RnfH family protein [Moritella sp. Urea-trap-13]|uniref:RnfH family protein n=1 Tax=Moritella sp. Urea-trap-13 TaxID=2058327 RepID=UPI000C32DCA4|nr:RnfH family protein [Moritella sp. Urea-trap-13]PKH05232.1 RnfH family protein [Moritella sp. Urea-trap-13]
MVLTKINVEVIYALPKEQITFKVSVEQGATALQVIEASGILIKYPEIEFTVNKIGIYSRLIKLDTVVEDGERVEIYRPLTADPKEMRKRRAGKAKEEGRLHEKTGQKIK